MIAKIVGVRDLNFTSKEGNQITGRTLHVEYEEQDVRGYATEKLFVSTKAKAPHYIELNTMVRIFFNQKGKVEEVELLHADEIGTAKK